RFRLAGANNARDDHIRVVERHPIRVRKAVPELAAFVNGARRLRCNVAADMAGEGELLEELAHAFLVLALVRINLGVSAFEVRGAEDAGRSVARPGHEDD